MTRRSFRSVSLATGFGLAMLLSFSADDASAYCQMTTQGGQQIGDEPCVEIGEPLVWANPCLSYAIDERGSFWMDYGDIENAVHAAFETWETAECTGGFSPNLVFQPSMVPSTCKRAEYNTVGNVSTIAFLDPWENPCADELDLLPYDSRAFAVTIVWYNEETGQILDADMMINDEEFIPGRGAGGPYADCSVSVCDGIYADLQGIVTHEAGHFIGIGHCNPDDVNDPDDPCVVATMFASAERNAISKRDLAPDDIAAVCDIYPPGNLSDSCIATQIGGLQLNCETDGNGNELACKAPGSTGSSGGCSTAQNPADAFWATLLALIGLTVIRRRSARPGARS